MHAFSKRFLLAPLFFLILALALIAPGSQAQVGSVAAAAPADAAKPYSYVFLDPLEGQHATQAADGKHVGVEMHGHWVIDVKNPDGTVAEHRDFENTIAQQGSELLTALMVGYVVPSDYAIFVQPAVNGTGPCAPLNGGNFQGCGVVRSLTTLPGSALCPNYFCATGLTYTPTLNDFGANSLVFAGTFTANQAGTISTVNTYFGTCPAAIGSQTSLTTVTPSACSTTAGSGGYRQLSGATITTVNVVASQIVQITVTITFS